MAEEAGEETISGAPALAATAALLPIAAAKAQLLQTRDLLTNCMGAGTEWLLPADSGAADSAASSAAGDEGEGDYAQGDVAATTSNGHASPVTATTETLPEEAVVELYGSGSSGGPSAVAEYFRLTPLPEFGRMEAEVGEQLEAAAAWLQAREAPAWLDAWNAEQSDSSSLSLAAAAAAEVAAEVAGRRAPAAAAVGGDRPGSGASVALSSPGSAPLHYPPLATRGGAIKGSTDAAAAAGEAADGLRGAGTAAEASLPGGCGEGAPAAEPGSTSGSALRWLHINAVYEAGRGEAGQAAGSSNEDADDSGSPASQLARLLDFPLTPDQPSTAAGSSAQGSGAGGDACSSLTGSGARARITRGASPSDAPPGSQERGGGSSSGTLVRSLGPQLQLDQLQQQVATLQLETNELREALAAAEASAAAYGDQVQLLRAQAAAAEEHAVGAAARQEAAGGALATALQEQAALQLQLEEAAAQRCALEQRQQLLHEQVELLLYERSEVAAGEGTGGDGMLLASAAELAAGNALMAEVQLLRQQLEGVVSSKQQLLALLARERAAVATLHTRLSATEAAREHEAARHVEAVAEHSAAAAARCGALARQNAAMAAQVAALQQQLAQEGEVAIATTAAATQCAEAAAAAAEEGQAVVVADLRRQLHAEQQARQEQAVVVADLRRQLHAEQQARQEQVAFAETAAAQVAQQAAVFSEALAQQQAAANYWWGQAEELSRQLAVAGEVGQEARKALQETCTKLVAQQQLSYEQQEELSFLRAKYGELSSQLEAAQAATQAAAAVPPQSSYQQQQGGWAPPAHPAVQQLSRQGSQDSSASAGSTPHSKRGGSAAVGGVSNSTGTKIGSWLGLHK